MNKELEEAVERLKKDKNKPLYCGDITIVNIDDLETVLNYIENSIPKERIEKQLQELKNMKVEGELFTTSVNFAVKNIEELLEEK